MEVGEQIKKYRSGMGLSQEALAEKIYVTRQTVSNWETGKNYPDIQSLLRLGALFRVSLDALIKGDAEVMKKEIQKNEIHRLNRYGTGFGVSLLAMILSAVPLAGWLGFYAFIPWGALFGLTLFFCVKTEKVKRDNSLRTYKEIAAFAGGKRLDEIETQQETGKHLYQRVLLAIGVGAGALIIGGVQAWLF